jgi:alcohol dehydrogenase
MKGIKMKRFAGFDFNLKTHIVFGKDAERKAAEEIRSHGGTRVMLVYGGGSIKKTGLYDIAVQALGKEGISFIELGGVKANPLRSYAIKGLDTAKAENIDYILAVGGGSAIDTAKAIALGLAYDGDFWDFYTNRAVPKDMAGLGIILTISAAGSETSNSSVLVDDVTGTYKRFVASDVLKPDFALLNPELTYTVSPYQTAAGACDIFSHSFDRYFTENSSFLADQFASGVMKSVIRYAPIALENPHDYEARAELMLAGSFSHNDVTGIGRPGAPFSIHGLESYISAKYDTVHGAGLAMITPAWIEYIVRRGGEERTARAAQFAADVFGVSPDFKDIRITAMEGARRLREWNRSIGMPEKLSDIGIPESDFSELVKNIRCNEKGILGGYLDLDKKGVEEIFRSIV